MLVTIEAQQAIRSLNDMCGLIKSDMNNLKDSLTREPNMQVRKENSSLTPNG